ncbi:hypothetical protein PC9H_004777 [Pleurotus ostreatus]|uniref:Uncharacterized protein n=1 Tax=Pleurotus ostreatus TaxID=5322 RepID=A0A8H7DTT2_PLEOS|nr:uncharacterized protein PC9H_004777 [Pleurotus ostreatus]KAF7432834.1 hypothetical protein PC9H_004777 [Pleurotus ostreatus]KAJ8698604.1 hypothetical protein PTI98_005297 [Pleurotus ostreatus]
MSAVFSRRELLGAATTSPWTKDFRHLKSFPRHWLKRSNIRGDPVLKSVRPADRIKYWNIVPGDQIRVLGDKTRTLREVLSINRISNRVFVRGTPNAGEEVKPGKVPQSKNFHYSRCQLFVGNYEFPADVGSTEPRILPVYAQRVGTMKPYWNRRCHRYEWTRFATRTVPKIPYLADEKITIPWPRPDKPTPAEPGAYDTQADVVSEVTYKPPQFPVSLRGPLPRPPPEQKFLRALTLPEGDFAEFEDAPVEVFLSKELANPHSRAKKQARWQAYTLFTKTLLQDYNAAELRSLNGRTPREAKAEAAWKWRAKLEELKKEQRKQRWKHKASVAKVERKNTRKARKELKKRERLTAMVLEDAPNQVAPKNIQL